LKPRNKPIEMLLTTNEKGIMTPVRFRYKDDEECLRVIPINKILYHEKLKDVTKQHYWLYRCQSMIEDRVITYEIKFNLESCKWILSKM
jgi:hypothetical protein